MLAFFSFFTVPAPTQIYTLSLHDALPILNLTALNSAGKQREALTGGGDVSVFQDSKNTHYGARLQIAPCDEDRKSTRLNSSHTVISYAVFCLKKKTNTIIALLDAASYTRD